MIKRTELSSTTGQWTKAKTETDKAPRTDEGAKLVLAETDPSRRGPRTGQGCDTCKKKRWVGEELGRRHQTLKKKH